MGLSKKGFQKMDSKKTKGILKTKPFYTNFSIYNVFSLSNIEKYIVFYRARAGTVQGHNL